MQSKSKSLPGLITPEKAEYHAEILSNRLKKQFRHFSRKYKKQNIDCYRLYDWDIKEVRAVVDWYAGHLVVGEYERLQTGEDWLPRMAKAAGEALNLPPENIHMKTRRTNVEEGPRYNKLDSKDERFQVRERDLKFWVNLNDYLDTGLFSDHRDTRVIINKLAEGKDFLNLYAYTGAFTCAAAAGKARSTVTVDRSATYINWAQDNLELNGLWNKQHTLIQSDVDEYLAKARDKGAKFTLAFVDPPSFFQDKVKQKSFDINRDHPQLLQNVLKVMARNSIVFFSTNHQRFEPKFEGLAVNDLVELTPKTIPEDYRNKTIHRCWKMAVR
jgi:23S rRNA G2069 N7-methylase RlmK/C1962 C5-methylase RlmI